ncbi:MAG TPA: carbamoyltransferase HypF [Desulfobulbaceae bacterium]|nr:carbamoyltransferase HypF [Desulfobulbaceae bacterium]
MLRKCFVRRFTKRPAAVQPIGLLLILTGVVQGVGFRPFVHGLARRFKLTGDIANTQEGVAIHLFGPRPNLHRFLVLLRQEIPPLARIDSLAVKPLSGSPPGNFRIIASHTSDGNTVSIPADIATCADCLREMGDPHDRRYRYPFINCTNCGPRLTIVASLPYDRPATVMRDFPLCDDCLAEYHDPSSRRFHAEAMACPVCGPRLTLVDAAGQTMEEEPLTFAANALAAGKIIALRGLGGFHLAVDAENAEAVARLRKRKHRPDKPFAVMAAHVDTALVFCHISTEEKALLTSPQAPIVLLRRREKDDLTGIAPGLADIGLMLPATPLHHLLLAESNCPRLLVMTSGNASGEPIAAANDEALSRLAAVADYFLVHDRDILTRLDDSVIRITESRPRLVRRSRGFIPAALSVPWDLPPLIACGPGLKTTISLAEGRRIHLSQHIGDLDNDAVFHLYQETIAHHRRLWRIEPRIAVCDLHPDYPSSRYAENLGLPVYKVQHHHAHAVAVMAEHGLNGKSLAVTLDGVGLGDDHSLWGGEILAVTPTDFRRLGHLSPLLLPGGDMASQEIWRLGLAALFAMGDDMNKDLPPSLAAVDPYKREFVAQMLAAGFNCPPTTSAGRLFDAIASLLGIRQQISYEGQAAIELETLALVAADDNRLSAPPEPDAPEIAMMIRQKDYLEIDSLALIRFARRAMGRNESLAVIALEFHLRLIAVFRRALNILRQQTGLNTVLLCGGCMQNRILLSGFIRCLRLDGFSVLSGERFPVHDGGVSIGQVIIGGLRHVYCHSDAGSGHERPAR